MLFEELRDFIKASPAPRFCIKTIERILGEAGFIRYYEEEEWELPCNNNVSGIYVIRGNAIIAISLPDKLEKFSGTITHLDSPCFKIKNNPEMFSNNYVKLNTMPYGFPIYYSWMDRPLSICGQLIDELGEIKDFDLGNEYQVFIPSQAIHINKNVNNSNPINPQIDMLPVWSLDSKNNFMDIISKVADITGKVYSMDATLYNPEEVKELSNGILMGPRFDNLASAHASLKTFVNMSKYSHGSAQVFAAFNNEEIGSMGIDGADSDFLEITLERVANMYKESKYYLYPRSGFLSIDSIHAVHPNASKKSDPTNVVELGKGVVVEHDCKNFATSMELEAIIKLQNLNDFEYTVQDFYARSDMDCGSTLGNISLTHHGIKTLDIGIPMLAMHSAIETISKHDYEQLIEVIRKFYHFFNS